MDEQIQTSEAPDGAEPNEQDQAPAKTGSERNDIEEAIHRRNTMSAERDRALARVATLEAEIKASKLPPGKAAPPEDNEAPDGATLAAVMVELRELRADMTGKQKSEARDRTVTAALDQVPELHRNQADLVLAGLEARGTIKLGAETTSDDLVSALHDHSPELLRAPGRRVAPQKAAGGAIRWDRYQSISEVPKDLIGQCPDKEWARLTKGAGSSRPMRL